MFKKVRYVTHKIFLQKYDLLHLPTKFPVDPDELHRRLKDLPKNKEIVAYCRGPICTLADEAVALLRQHGYTATKLDVGYPEWQMSKL
ncbi:MAG: rhodanese-like domain-containing protein [Balneolaceae bacterium]